MSFPHVFSSCYCWLSQNSFTCLDLSLFRNSSFGQNPLLLRCPVLSVYFLEEWKQIMNLFTWSCLCLKMTKKTPENRRLPSESWGLRGTGSLWYEGEGSLTIEDWTKEKRRSNGWLCLSRHYSREKEIYSKDAGYLSSLRQSWIWGR